MQASKGKTMGKIILITYDTRESKSISTALRSSKYMVWEARTVEEASHIARNEHPDIITIDVPSPTISFHRLQKSLGNDIQFSRTPFIIFLPENTAEIKILKKSAPVEFLKKPFEVNTLLKKAAVLIEAKKAAEEQLVNEKLHDSKPEAEILEFRKLIKSLEEESKHSKDEVIAIKSQIKDSYIETGKMIVELVEERDIFEKGHSIRVSEYSAAMAHTLKLSQEEKEKLINASLLHDIGKIFISPTILGKPTALTDSELEVIKSHPIKGQRLLQSLSDMESIAEIILLHHEQPNGKGYYKKKAQEIPIFSKIIAVSEAFDAMTTSRISSKPLSFEQALAQLKKGKGTKYDKNCVEALISHFHQNNL